MAHKGTSTFIIQRATAAVLIPLAIWFLIGVTSHLGADYASARLWISKPINGVLMALFISIGALHMRIGMSEIIADYIHGALKKPLSMINWLTAIGIIAASFWALFNLTFAS